mgnify:CR=1 FL=1
MPKSDCGNHVKLQRKFKDVYQTLCSWTGQVTKLISAFWENLAEELDTSEVNLNVQAWGRRLTDL